MPALQPGDIVNGRYELLHPGSPVPGVERWIGRDTTLHRHVDLWITPDDHPLAAAAQDAARRAALVEDGRLPRVLDIGVEDGLQWVVTQHDARSRSLVELVEEGPLPAHEARRLVGEAALALELARRHGVHHLALTPESLRRDADGGVVVTGLGLAAALAGTDSLDADRAAQRDTRGLLALLHAGLTGTWGGDTASALPRAERDGLGVVRPSEVVDHVPHDLDELCSHLGLGGHPVLNGQEVRTPGELAEVLAPWNSSTVPGRGRRRDRGAASDTTRAVPAAGAVTTAVPAAGPEQSGSTPEETTADAPTTTIPVVGAAAASAAASGQASSASGPEATGAAAGEAVDAEAPEATHTDSTEEGPQDRPAAAAAGGTGGPGRTQLLVAGLGALGAAAALALLALGAPHLLGGDDAEDSAAPTSTTQPGSPAPAEPAPEDTPTPTASSPQDVTPSPDDTTGQGDEPSPDSGTPSQTDGPTGTEPADTATDGDTPTPTTQDTASDSPEPTTAPAPTPTTPSPEAPESPTTTRETRPSPSESPSASAPSSEGSAPGKPYRLHGIIGYDPFHDGDEHTDWTHRINNPATDLAWSTHKYDHPPFGGYTDALGLRVDLGDLRTVHAVDIGMPQGDWTYEVRVGPSQDVGRAVTIGGRRGGGDVTWTAEKPVQGRYVFVWFTGTGQGPDGKWTAQLKDITVR